MRVFIILIFLLFNNFKSFTQRIPVDKQLHLGAGIVIGNQSALDKTAKYPFWNAVIFSSVVGVGKEVMDIGNGNVDPMDAVYTIGGGFIGGGVTYLIRKKINNRNRGKK